MTLLAWSLILLLAEATAVQGEGVKGARSTIQFQHWYGQFGFIFKQLLVQNCSSEYHNYLTSTPQNATIDRYGGGDEWNTLAQPVVGCLLEATPQYLMSSMQSAQVLLGLTPTILAILGASTDESATLAVVGKRPLLSLLLACGSPSVYLSRAFEFKDPLEILSKHRPQRYSQASLGNKSHAFLLVAEYVLALTAVANVAVVNWQLAIQSVCGFETEFILMPLIWSTTIILVHLAGNFWLSLRVERVRKDQPRRKSWGQRLARLLHSELRLSLANGPVDVVTHKESKIQIVLGWCLSVASVLHIIFGTLVLSSLLFIGPRDALSIIGRFLGSALLCRIITMYELAGLRENFRQQTKLVDASNGPGTVSAKEPEVKSPNITQASVKRGNVPASA